MTTINSIVTGTIFIMMWTGAGLRVANATSSSAAIRAAGYSDPISGLHWRRIADPQHPSAPPRLALVESIDGVSGVRPPTAICVRAGDPVLLQSSGRKSAEISLRATALASGAAGDRIRARVTVTGAIVEMMVLGPDAGTIAAKTGAW